MSGESFEERVQPTSEDEETIRRQAAIARPITTLARHIRSASPDPAADMRFSARCFEALAEMYEEELS